MSRFILHLRVRSLFLCIALPVLFTACERSTATDQIVDTPQQTSKPTTIDPQIETPVLPTISPLSSLAFSFISGDAGNFTLLAGETITFTWEHAPIGADKYEFVLVPLNKEPAFVLGIDFDDADGVAVSWIIPEHIAADLHVIAYFPDDGKIESSAYTIYSGDYPPVDVCSLLAPHQPIEVYRLPDRTAEIFALLYPTVFATVLEIAPDDWYRIDASVAELYTPSRGLLPDNGVHYIAVNVPLISDLAPASGDGWVNSDKGVLLTGPCPPKGE